MKNKLVILLVILLSHTVFAHDGSEGGGGGNAQEMAVDEIRVVVVYRAVN
jgi:hypothetical protein